ncbi:MAG: hypothetical protein HYY16_03265 [Planctomycetes bacterium]|nr:hypothetical protein [Planctomycetota bacterium]
MPSLGHKAANLERLGRAGLPVPRWFCVTDAVGEAELLHLFDRHFAPDARVAVRSSAAGEDSAKDSFAGQLETVLWVSRDRIAEHVRAVLASSRSDRAIQYRRLRQLQDPTHSAAIVQEMVDARSSGVLFTVHPTNGDPNETVVTAAYGLGEGVVSDRVETDTYLLDRRRRAIRDRRIARKTSRIGPAGLEEVPADLATRPVLGDDELRALLVIGEKIEAEFGSPQDIEWAIDQQGKIHLLQARPITTLPSGRERIFDNSNIVEGYPGVTTPLTFSFVRSAYEETFRQSARAFGVPEPVLETERALFATMIGLIDGRIYYNILNWYRLYTLLPGFERHIPAWEKALGLAPRAEAPRRASLWRRFAATLRVARLFWRQDREVARFNERFAHAQALFRSRPVEHLDADELLDLYERIWAELMPVWHVTLINDFFAFQLYDKLGRLVGDAALRNELLCGETKMESLEPLASLLRTAERIRADGGLRALLERDDAWDALQPHLGKEFAEHIARYGDRTTGELKLETPTLDDDPTQLVPLLRTYVATGQTIAAMEERERRSRRDAEGAVRLTGARRLAYRFVLRHTRAAVRHRENMRLARTRVFGMVKRIFRSLGRIFEEGESLSSRDDIFFLTVEEIFGYVRGTSVTRHLADLVALRRREVEAFGKSRPAPRVETRGIVYENVFPAALSTPMPESRVLRGLGCSPGRARGRARIVYEPTPNAAVPGEILIARMTDPGWVFLMASAGGLVVERGSLLSHTAIIGRELGIPTVVGVDGATRAIADGQEIEIDGREGTVRLL